MSEIWGNRALIVSAYHFGLCTSAEQFRGEMCRLGFPERVHPPFLAEGKSGRVHYFETPEGRQCALVCLGDTEGRSGIEIAALLVHEAVHIWQLIVEDMNEKNPSREFEAYSIQAISLQLMDLYEQSIKETR